MLRVRGSHSLLLTASVTIGAFVAAAATAQPAPTASPTPAAPPGALIGWVDLHTHPMVNLAFGGKLIAGGVDVGSLLPADPSCNHNVRATSWQQALGDDRAIAGGYDLFKNGCGDDIREAVISALQDANHALKTSFGARGAPDFPVWPAWNDITHQKMWVDWIRRAKDAGERVLIALAVNNKTIGDAVAGPGDYPTDDKSSADLQLRELKAFVARHPDFMRIAYTPAELQSIVASGKLAVVLGTEIDDIGDFNTVPNLSEAQVNAELDRLWNEGVRYIFPIHVIDNPFGGTAVYTGAFNVSNYREAGHFWNLACSAPGDMITYRYTPDGFDVAVAAVKAVKLHIDIARNPPSPPNCAPGTGDVNRQGLTRMGEFAITQMMKKGFIIDIDHMSQKSANRALDLATGVPLGGYPLVSGHTGIRGVNGANAENSRTEEQLKRIAALGGMFGLGTADQTAYDWIDEYARAVRIMRTPGAVAMGTDLNGLVKAPRPRHGSHVVYSAHFPASTMGSRTWDYNRVGVAHYGMLADFLVDAKTAPNGTYLVDSILNRSADYFYHMWLKIDAQKSRVGKSTIAAEAQAAHAPVAVAAPASSGAGRGAAVVRAPAVVAPASRAGAGAAAAPQRAAPPSSPAPAAVRATVAPIRSAAVAAGAARAQLKLILEQGRGAARGTWWVLVRAVDASTGAGRVGVVRINGTIGPTGKRLVFRECVVNRAVGKCPGTVSARNYANVSFEAGPGS